MINLNVTGKKRLWGGGIEPNPIILTPRGNNKISKDLFFAYSKYYMPPPPPLKSGLKKNYN